jgi:hypothetical protein
MIAETLEVRDHIGAEHIEPEQDFLGYSNRLKSRYFCLPPPGVD